MLVPGLVIFFPMVRGGGTVRVCGEFVEFGSSLVRVIWHGVFYPRFSIPGFRSTLESSRFPSCSITDISGECRLGEEVSSHRLRKRIGLRESSLSLTDIRCAGAKTL
jgi:hypothetical protein